MEVAVRRYVATTVKPRAEEAEIGHCNGTITIQVCRRIEAGRVLVRAKHRLDPCKVVRCYAVVTVNVPLDLGPHIQVHGRAALDTDRRSGGLQTMSTLYMHIEDARRQVIEE